MSGQMLPPVTVRTAHVPHLQSTTLLSHWPHTLIYHNPAVTHIQMLQPTTVLSHCPQTLICHIPAVAECSAAKIHEGVG